MAAGRLPAHSRRPALLQIKVYRQPWCRLKWSQPRADRYLAPAPKGAFIVRRAPRKGDFVLSVQSGIRVCHVRLRVGSGERGTQGGGRALFLHTAAAALHFFTSLHADALP